MWANAVTHIFVAFGRSIPSANRRDRTSAMPEIVRAFGTTEAAVKMALSSYFAGFALAQLICGPLSDGYGRRPITFAFMVIYLAATVAALLSPTIELLVLARFFQGVGAAVLLWLTFAAATSEKYGWQHVLLLNGVLGTRSWSEAWHYWFVEAMVQLLILLAVLLAVGPIRRLERRFQYLFPLALLCGALALRE